MWNIARHFYLPCFRRVVDSRFEGTQGINFLLLLLKTSSICVRHFLWKSYVFAMRAYELPWYKILFSGINWHRYEVYSNQNFSSFSLRKSFIHSCTVFRKLRRPKSYRRSSLLQIFYKIGALKSHAKLTEKHICLRFIFIKVAVWRAATLSKNKLWHSYFPKNFAKFLRAPPVKNTSGQLLLTASICFYHLKCQIIKFFF